MKTHCVRPTLAGVLLALALGIVGCGGSKEFTPEEFATVTKDMTEAQVVGILGKPKETHEGLGVRRLFWASKDKYYSISFTDGKVTAPLVHGTKEDYDMMIGLMKMTKNMGK